MTLVIEQESTQTGKDSWSWSVWLEGSDEDLDGIEEVEYLLHSTFKDPVVTTRRRDTKFRLDGRGWGGFLIRLRVTKRSGEVVEMSHQLQLFHEDYASPERRQVLVTYPVSEAELANQLSASLLRHGVSPLALEAQSGFAQESRRQDGIVAVLPDSVPLWLEREIAQATQDGQRVFAASRHPGASTNSAGLSDLPTSPIDDQESMDAFAEEVANSFTNDSDSAE